jgi:hypothetical protein
MAWVGRGCLGSGQSHMAHDSDHGGTVHRSQNYHEARRKFRRAKRASSLSPSPKCPLAPHRKSSCDLDDRKTFHTENYPDSSRKLFGCQQRRLTCLRVTQQATDNRTVC